MVLHTEAYFLTWTTFGTWLHGDARGSVERTKSDRPGRRLAPSQNREDLARSLLHQTPCEFTVEMRLVVDSAIRDHCAIRGWKLLAVNVRTNHVHAVVQARVNPDQVMNQLKSWGTRRLREMSLVAADYQVWTRHGSTRRVLGLERIQAAVDYTLNRQ